MVADSRSPTPTAVADPLFHTGSTLCTKWVSIQPDPSGLDAVPTVGGPPSSDPVAMPGRPAQADPNDMSFSHWLTMSDDVTETSEFDRVVALLDDEFAREILARTSTEPMTVTELSDRMEADDSTLYRRVERLEDAELLVEQSRIRSDGHHDTVYAPALEHVQISLADGEFSIRIDRQTEDAADRLQRLWGDL